MPKKGGYDVAAFVKGRADLEHIPVLLLAGAFEPVDQARAEQVRCDGVLIKPFEPRQVIERVRELLEGVKGSPAQATADVLRPVERLSPRPEPQLPSRGRGRRAVAGRAAGRRRRRPTPCSQSDPALDDYFESLNAAFESVGQAGTPAIVVARRPADRSRRRAGARRADARSATVRRADAAAAARRLARRLLRPPEHGLRTRQARGRAAPAARRVRRTDRRTRACRRVDALVGTAKAVRATASARQRRTRRASNGHERAAQPDRRGARGHARPRPSRPGAADAADAARPARRAAANGNGARGAAATWPTPSPSACSSGSCPRSPPPCSGSCRKRSIGSAASLEAGRLQAGLRPACADRPTTMG